MAEHLFIRIDEPTGTCSSLVLDADGRAIRGLSRGTLGEVTADSEGRRVTLLVPGPDVVTARIALPAMSAARLRQTLPYSLEDQLAEDVEDLHFAAGRRLPSGEVPVSAVARARLEDWLGRLAERDIVPQAIFADTDGVPDTPSTLSLIVEGERVYGRRPGQAPFVLEDLPLTEVFDLVAAQQREGSDEVRHIDLYLEPGAETGLDNVIEALRERVASVEPRVLGDGVLGRLATTLLFEPGTNLRQGRYALKSNVATLARPWYSAAGLAAAFVALAFVAAGVEYFKLGREDRALAQYLAETCEARFGTRRLSDCESQVGRLLNAAGVDTDPEGETFLSALAAIAEFNAAESRIEALSYRNGEMSLEMRTQSIPALDEFARRIEQTQRFEVRIQSANPREDGVEGRVRLVEASQ